MKHPDSPFSAPQHLIPAGLNVVLRIDWTRAGEQEVQPQLLGYLSAFGLEDRLLKAIQGCLENATILWIAFRLSREGFEGDALVLVEAPAGKGREACGSKDWRPLRLVRDMALFAPATEDQDRRAPALMGMDPRGFHWVASTAEVDPLLRILREGPDRNRLQPEPEGMLTLEARLGPDAIPGSLGGKVPVAAEIARGLEFMRLTIDAPGTVRIRATLSYESDIQAKKAGEALTRFRQGVLNSDKAEWKAAARTSHANLFDNVVKVVLEIPMGAASANPTPSADR